MFKKVKHDASAFIFTAIDETNRKVTIDESISFIYKVEAADKKVIYRAMDYHNGDVMEELDKYFRGQPFNKEIIETIVIRYGWMDKILNKLEFVPLMDLINKFYDKTATSTDKSKFKAILKQLSLSKKFVTII